MSQALDKQINSYLPLLHSDEKKSLLGVIKSFLSHRQEERDERISIEQYNKEIDEAMAECERGEFISNDEMKRLVKTWR